MRQRDATDPCMNAVAEPDSNTYAALDRGPDAC